MTQGYQLDSLEAKFSFPFFGFNSLGFGIGTLPRACQFYLYPDTVANVLDPEHVGDVPDPPVAEDTAVSCHNRDKLGHLVLC